MNDPKYDFIFGFDSDDRSLAFRIAEWLRLEGVDVYEIKADELEPTGIWIKPPSKSAR